MKLDVFCKDAIEKYTNNQIDAFFCYIQSDKELMKKYLDLVADKKDLRIVNSTIAKKFAENNRTKSCGQRSNEPNSTLIQSYSILED